jgi:hypothetical protein
LARRHLAREGVSTGPLLRAVLATDRYDPLEQNEYRELVRREVGKTYKRSGNVIVPYGFALGFTGPDGGEFRFSIDEDGALTFGKLAETPISVASVAYVTAVTAGFDESIALVTSEILAARDGEISLLAKINTVELAIVSGDTAVALTITTLTATVNGNTSSISNIAQAYATNSATSARLIWSVNAATNAAVIEQTAHSGYADGTWNGSAIRMSAGQIVFNAADAFKVYNGTTDEAPFEISGGVVKIKTANVGDLNATNITTGTLNVARINAGSIVTDKLAVNAVSSGVSDETDASQLFDQTWTTIASVSVTTPDANSLIYLPFSMYVESVGFDATIAEARILRGATNIYQTDICGEPPTLDFETPADGPVHYAPTFNGQVAGFDTDAPGAAGTYTYYLQCRTNGTGSDPFRYWSATKRRLFALLFKR